MSDIVERNMQRAKQFETELEDLLSREIPLYGPYKRYKLAQLIMVLHIKHCTNLVGDLRAELKESEEE